jgi:hypothetical protein
MAIRNATKLEILEEEVLSARRRYVQELTSLQVEVQKEVVSASGGNHPVHSNIANAFRDATAMMLNLLKAKSALKGYEEALEETQVWRNELGRGCK